MTSQDYFELTKQYLEYCGFHYLAMYEVEKEIENMDQGLRKNMTSGFDGCKIGRRLLKHMETEVHYILEDDLDMFYSLFRFPDALAEELHCRILSIGPFIAHPISTSRFKRLIAGKGIPPAYEQDFLEFYNHTPILAERDLLFHSVNFYLSGICGRQVAVQEILPETKSWALFAPPFTDYSVPSQPDVAFNVIAERYQAEQSLLDAVAAGNLEAAEKLHHSFLNYRLVPRNPSPLRDKKNLTITFNTLLRKAAQAGGVHPLHIDSLSRQLAIEIESSRSVEQLERLSPVMVRKYCLLVQNYSRRGFSPTVQTCLDTIDFYYNTELSLAGLAKLCSVSENHLSALFKKETGTTVTDYINDTRIRQSISLLNTTSLPVGEIASRCGFLDANYFTRLFKKRLGKSPREYRKAVRGGAA